MSDGSFNPCFRTHCTNCSTELKRKIEQRSGTWLFKESRRLIEQAKKMSAQIANLRKERSEMSCKLTTSRNQIEELERENHHLKVLDFFSPGSFPTLRIADLECELTAARKEIRRLGECLLMKNTEIPYKLHAARKRVEALERENSELQLLLSCSTSGYARNWPRELAAMKAERDELRYQCTELRKERSEVSCKRKTCHDKLTAARKRADELERENFALAAGQCPHGTGDDYGHVVCGWDFGKPGGDHSVVWCYNPDYIKTGLPVTTWRKLHTAPDRRFYNCELGTHTCMSNDCGPCPMILRRRLSL